MTIRHFLDISKLDTATLRGILDMGAAYKKKRGPVQPFTGKTLAMIFSKPSTRTRVSFEVGMQQLGGRAVIISDGDSQLGRGETIADTARVLSRYVEAIMIRTDDHAKLLELAEHATVPVINGLTDHSHPCQLMADIMTVEEKLGPIAGKTVAWSGDGNNMAITWIHAAVKFGFALRLACPAELSPLGETLDWAKAQGGDVALTTDPNAAAAAADAIVTDTWVSMGDKDAERRCKLLAPFQVNEALMALAKSDAIFLHCLPAHRGEEVTDAVMDGPNSVVWDEAENRLHAQKGVLTWCLDGPTP